MAEIWAKLENKNSLMQKGTQYRNMQAWSRPCVLCKQEFVAYTPGSSPPDRPPTVTTCEEHRGAPNGINSGWLAWDGENVTPGPRMKKFAASTGSLASAELAEVTKQRDEAWERSIELMAERGDLLRKYETAFNELQVFKAKLVTYELPAAMAAQEKLPWG